ncbi:MAG: NAD(P)-dependent oxidoreductase [Phycisphaeraceae bacterium]
MARPQVLITETLDEVPAGWLAQRADVTWARHEQGGDLTPHLPQAQGMIVRTYTQVNQALLDRAPLLRVVGRAGVGLDNIDVAACRRRGVEVVYTPDANTQAVVEYVLGLMLDLYRPRTRMSRAVTDSEFHALRKSQVGRQLDELTLGILGFGRIGKRLGQVAHAIGMNLLVNDLLPEAEMRKAVDYPFDYVDKARLYAESDIVTIHVDGRAANRGLIDAAALGQLKPTCVLINAARGMLVDTPALAAWARQAEEQGGKAVLDVHDPEPPLPSYELYGLPNVHLLPHLASRTDRALENMSWVARDVMAVLEGRKPQYPAP